MMARIESRLQALEDRLLPSPAIEPMFLVVRDQTVAEPGQPEPVLVTDADLTGFRAGDLEVKRIPGESCADLEKRCRLMAPDRLVWLGRYSGHGI